MNNKGITLVTLVVMIIVMIILVTVSFVAGNKLIVNSKDHNLEQEIESVRAAVSRKKTEIDMSGYMTPVGESYVGIKDPILGSDGADSIVATGWYYLEESHLEKLGVYDVNTGYIVNYDYEIVLSVKDKEYMEEFMLVESMYEHIKNGTAAGIELKNKTASEPDNKMVKNKENSDLYGTGWYLLKKASGDFDAKYESYINNNYLINFKTKEYVKMNSNFEEI